MQNVLFVKDCLENELPEAFNYYFNKIQTRHNHSTRSSTKNLVTTESNKTTLYGKDSLKSRSVKLWNEFQNTIDLDLLDLDRFKVKTKITDYFLNSLYLHG